MEEIKKTQADEDEELLDAQFLRKIERLSLVARRVFAGQLRGERRSTKRGASVEFADYRNYTVGDDFRRVDWNVYARLEKLFLKLFVEEEDLHVYLLLDSSRSMDFGSPTKLLYAKRIAAALSYIALANLDRVGLAALSGTKATILPPKRSKQSALGIFNWLKSVRASGETQLSSSLREFSLKTARPGLAIVISDFFDADYEKGLQSLLARRFELVLLHVMDQEELEPSAVGDLLLVDSETNERREVTITAALLRRYRERLSEFTGGLQDFASRYGCNYVRVTNQAGLDGLLTSVLRRLAGSRG